MYDEKSGWSNLRTSLASYGDVLRAPGAARPAAGMALASLPIGMLSLAVLLLVEQAQSSFAAAGLVVGLLGLGTGLGIAIQGRLIDRVGQSRVLLVAAAVQSAALVILIASVHYRAESWVLAASAFAAGAGEPQVGGSMRGLWNVLVPVDKRQTATALSSLLFEGPVIVGPLLLAVVLTIASPTVAVLMCGLFFATGAWVFARSTAARQWRSAPRRGTSRWGALASRGVRAVTLIAATQGLVTGLLQVSVAAFATEHAGAGSAAMLYALLSVGSLLGTVVYGARTWRGSRAVRLSMLLCLLAGVLGLASITSTVPLLGLAVLAAGLLLGPLAVCCFSLIQDLAPSGALVEAFTTLTAAGLGAAAGGAAAAGWIVSRTGPAQSLLVAGAIALLVGLTLLGVARSSPRFPIRPSA
jgi:MFS family permease